MDNMYEQAIATLLHTKNAPKYYTVKSICTDEADDPVECSFLSPLTDSDVEAIEALKASYCQDYVKHLIDHFEEQDAIDDLGGGGEIIDIETAGEIYYKVRFTAHVNKKEGLASHPLNLMLSEPVYERLVEICMVESGITFNTVFRMSPGVAQELYLAVQNELGEEFSTGDLDKYPFYITMDEAKEDARKAKDLMFARPSEGSENLEIWRITDAFETDTLYASLDYASLTSAVEKIFSHADEEDRLLYGLGREEEPLTEQVFHNLTEQIQTEGDNRIAVGAFELSPVTLNTLIESGIVLASDPDFKVQKGAVVYEAALRITMGCDQSYALEPLGYFTSKIDHPALKGAEWIERTLL